MVTVKFNHKHRYFVFIFSALFAALSTSLIILYNDFLDDFIIDKIENKKTKAFFKASAHIFTIFITTLLVNLLMYNNFDWAPAASWKKKITI